MNKKSMKVTTAQVVKVAAATLIGLGLVAATIVGAINNNSLKVKNTQLGEGLLQLNNSLTLAEQQESLRAEQIAELQKDINQYGLIIETLDDKTLEQNEVIADYESLLSEMQLQQDILISEAIAEVTAGYVGTFSAFEKSELSLDFKGRILIDDNDFDKLVDSEVEFDDEDIEYASFMTLYGAFASNEKDFEGETMYMLDRESVAYDIRFDTNMKNLDWSADTVVVDFLGETFEIANWKDGEITLISDANQFVAKGEVVAGVTLLKVGRDSVAVKYKDQVEVIGENDSFESDDIEVKVESIFFADGSEDDGAVLVVASDLERKIKDGDEYDDSEVFEWFVNNKAFGIKLAERYDDFDTALKEGASFSLPNDFASFGFELSTPGMTDVTFEYDKDGFVKIKADFEDFEGDIYAYADGTFYDKADKEFTSSKRIYLKNSDAFITFDTAGNLRVKDVTIGIGVDNVFVNDVDMSTKDVNVKSVYGIVVDAPEDDIEDNELSISVPEEAIEITIKVD